MQQLMIAEVKAEEASHARFEAGLASWRTLRTQHAMRLFNERLAGELAEPTACLAIFKQLTHDQTLAYQVYTGPLCIRDVFKSHVHQEQEQLVLAQLQPSRSGNRLAVLMIKILCYLGIAALVAA